MVVPRLTTSGLSWKVPWAASGVTVVGRIRCRADITEGHKRYVAEILSEILIGGLERGGTWERSPVM